MILSLHCIDQSNNQYKRQESAVYYTEAMIYLGIFVFFERLN